MRYLLDTNIISDLLRRPHSPVQDRIAEVGEANVLTSIVVAAELRYGAAKLGSPALSRRLDQMLARIDVAPLEAPADRYYGEARAVLARRGRLIGPNDLLIAAHALALDCTLVTDNVREFSRVPGLTIENWLR